MKRVILAVATLVTLGICGVGALLAAGYQKNHQLQTPVFRAIADEDAEGFLALCDHRLRDEIDPPVLTDVDACTERFARSMQIRAYRFLQRQLRKASLTKRSSKATAE